MLRTDPVFVVGCPHSATTLMLAILGAHSAIWPVPYESWAALSSGKHWQVEDWDTAAKKEGGCRRWCEKTPLHALKIPAIQKRFPGSPIVALRRDGRDVVCSQFARNKEWCKPLNLWIKVNKELDQREGDSVIIIRYEDIVEDFEKEIRRVCSFIGEDYEDDMRNFPGSIHRYCGCSTPSEKPTRFRGKKHLLNRAWQVNQPLFDGRGRWKDGLPDKAKKLFDGEGNELLKKYGYLEKEI